MRKPKLMNKILFGLSLLILTGCVNSDNKSEIAEFTLDFSKPKKYIYSFSQTSTSKTKWKKNDQFDKTKSVADGNLNIRIKENNLADLSVTDLETSLIIYDKKGKEIDTISNTAPVMVIQNMNQNGTFENNEHNFMFDLIFPLPTKNIKLGESDKIPMQIPFNVNGSKLFIKGHNTLRYNGIETIDGKQCAVLIGEIDISKIEIPEELESTHKSSTTGNGTYYFDLANKYFVGSDIEVKMTTASEKKNEKSKNDISFGNTNSESKIEIRLIKIEE